MVSRVLGYWDLRIRQSMKKMPPSAPKALGQGLHWWVTPSHQDWLHTCTSHFWCSQPLLQGTFPAPILLTQEILECRLHSSCPKGTSL